jgi:signal transduction histidine kinase
MCSGRMECRPDGHNRRVASARAAIFPTGLTVLRALVAARWLCWMWMVAVVVVSWDRDGLRRPIGAWAAVLVVLGVCSFATHAVRVAPQRLLTPGFALAEASVAIGVSIADGWVFEAGHVFQTSQSIATQLPFVAMASIGFAVGPWWALAAGALMGPAEWIGARLNMFGRFEPRHVVSLVATSLFFGAAGWVLGWLATRLSSVEAEIADQHARNEVALVLHDTVLQTLALVETRSSTADPDLARAARDADRDLRRFLFGAPTHDHDDIGARVRGVVERTTRHHDVDVVVNVLDDGCRSTSAAQHAMVGALGEALANAVKHARPSRIVVFAETDERGELFASVRDDGVGFVVQEGFAGRSCERPGEGEGDDGKVGVGLTESIVGRMQRVGGHAQVMSQPGSGTEVRLWTKAPSDR